MFFRIGYSDNKPYHTPRKDVSMVLDSENSLVNFINPDIGLKKIKIGKHKINYATLGEGKPLILIHGGNLGWGQWFPNIDELAKHFKVYALDMPGGGKSSTVDLASVNLEEVMVRTVEEFVKELGLKEVSLVGSSVGGWVTARLAIRQRMKINKIVLADPLGFSDFVTIRDRIIGRHFIAKFLTRTLMKPNRNNPNLEKLMRSVFYKKNTSLPSQFVDYFYDNMHRSHNLIYISRLARDMKKLNLYDEVVEIEAPALVIWGEKDELIPLERTKNHIKLIPNANLKTISNAGHIPSIERHEEFNEAVIDFLL